MTFDCMKCGACCSAFEVRFLGPHSVNEKYYIKINPTVSELKKDSNMRCCALEGDVGKSVKCSIYEDRPSVCSNFENGGERCIALRKRLSIT